MLVFRVVHERQVGVAWDGVGGRLASGRWHTRGRPIAHASEHAALSVLETLVHLPTPDLTNFRLLEAEVPEAEIESLEPERWPANWDSAVPLRLTQDIGDAWLRSRASLAMRVPSALVPGWNVLINPEHPAFANLRPTGAARRFHFAERSAS
ncbi:MAG: RES family NAD+ phosphorylase [Thermoplasmatota archaeon]